MCLARHDVLKIDIVSKANKGVNGVHLEELANRVRAMSDEELEVVLDNIPIDLCFRRVEKEIMRTRSFEEAVKNTIDSFMTDRIDIWGRS